MQLIELDTIANRVRALASPLELRLDKGDIPQTALEALDTLLAIERGLIIVDKKIENLYKDLKVKERSMVHHSLNCAKLTALNGKALNQIHQLEKQIKNLKEGL